jgi:hypothetical protein
MSFTPKPVNFALNRDMLGKVLMHTREDMVNEVEKMTFETEGDTLTLDQVRLYLSRLDLRVCSEPGCVKLIGDCVWYRCLECDLTTCYEHTWYIDGTNNHTGMRTCSGCRYDVCTCGAIFTYNNNRTTYHVCKVD